MVRHAATKLGFGETENQDTISFMEFKGGGRMPHQLGHHSQARYSLDWKFALLAQTDRPTDRMRPIYLSNELEQPPPEGIFTCRSSSFSNQRTCLPTILVTFLTTITLGQSIFASKY